MKEIPQIVCKQLTERLSERSRTEQCLLELFKFPGRIVPLFPHVVKVTQGISQIADGTVSLSAQIITQSPAKTQQRHTQVSASAVACHQIPRLLNSVANVTVCSLSQQQSCLFPERPSLCDTWPPRPPAQPPSAPGTWLHTASATHQSPYWHAPCPAWPSLVSVSKTFMMNMIADDFITKMCFKA